MPGYTAHTLSSHFVDAHPDLDRLIDIVVDCLDPQDDVIISALTTPPRVVAIVRGATGDVVRLTDDGVSVAPMGATLAGWDHV